VPMTDVLAILDSGRYPKTPGWSANRKLSRNGLRGSRISLPPSRLLDSDVLERNLRFARQSTRMLPGLCL
jgi:hypothetical protein